MTEVLAHKIAIGAISRCSHGCFHLQFGRSSITMTECEYIELVALINESAANYELLCQPQAHTGWDPTGSGPVADAAEGAEYES